MKKRASGRDMARRESKEGTDPREKQKNRGKKKSVHRTQQLFEALLDRPLHLRRRPRALRGRMRLWSVRKDVERPRIDTLRQIFYQTSNLCRTAEEHLKEYPSRRPSDCPSCLHKMGSRRTLVSGRFPAPCFFEDTNELMLPLDPDRACSLKCS